MLDAFSVWLCVGICFVLPFGYLLCASLFALLAVCFVLNSRCCLYLLLCMFVLVVWVAWLILRLRKRVMVNSVACTLWSLYAYCWLLFMYV